MFHISALIFLFFFYISSAKNIPAIFIFGDSIVDVGNNNYINTIAKAAFPNGIDFCRRCSSGRFTNGRTVIDILEQDLGAKNFTPPYLAPTTTGDMVLRGVNYASSGSGILSNTGIVWGDHIGFYEQISNFEKTKKTIVSRIGRREAKRLLKHRALFVVVIGANDLFFGQQITFLQNRSSQGQRAYLNILTSTLKSQLTRLYYLEARKIVVTNVPRIGCSPYERDNYPNGKGCVGSLNKPIHSYNRRLKRLLMDLTANQTGSTYVYADIHAILEDILHNYKSYGFRNADSACCHSGGAHGGLVPCFPLSKFCSDRTKYVFWDAFHLTETSNLIAARHMMDGGLKYMSPMNIPQLVHS
ncbi:GDSL esterase/lipase At4g16230-like [Durio zibethinus]|uniref:GDSL esterase/lipase At4g16230-like n=1 Tax=Durio zibethinus TaxID=66656 RepID=A0A6P5Z8G8_DURZI|nr:GDSL esterase/lipase At4g16230-like [Durio zibethinus]